MYTDIFNIGLAFLEGFALIISPCILPILPIVLSGSLVGDRRRPLGIIVGFIIAFTVVTLFTRFLTQALQIDAEIIRVVSLVLLLLVGILMMSSYLSERFTLMTQGLMRVGNKTQQDTGFFGGIIFGVLVGIIWTPCAGPILAAIIVQVILQKTTFSSVLIIVAFAIGAALPMLIIALAGRSIMKHFNFFRTHGEAIRKILGAIIILSVVILYFNPTLGIEDDAIRTSEITGDQLLKPIAKPFPAPAIEGITAWINSPPLKISELKGKVVLIDFWTYSCINCIRTLPYLKSWYAKYRDKGFIIIGVHSPEFAFEHRLENVEEAVKKFGILYPVALDNQFKSWQNYYNRYWPAHYLIDQKGNVIYIHFGEGEYHVTENNIRYLLGLNQTKGDVQKRQYNKMQTPETYLGYARNNGFASPESISKDQMQEYSIPTSLVANQWALQGAWTIAAEKIITQSSNTKLKLHFNAQHVYAVMGIQQTPVKVKVRFNGNLINQSIPDMQNSEITVSTNRLYELLKFSQPTQGYLELEIANPGLEIYTFTFG